MFSVNNHKLSGAHWCPSPNFNARPNQVVDALVVHNISLPPNQFGGNYIASFFCNTLDCSIHPYFEQIKGVEVSAHLLIKRSGDVVQFVAFNQRAWHAGVSSLDGKDNCNDFSIGIELEGADDIDYEDIQYEVLINVTNILLKAYPAITAERVVGHNEIAPGRKTDPGPAFNWPQYKKRIQTL
jgi:AmpD protein